MNVLILCLQKREGGKYGERRKVGMATKGGERDEMSRQARHEEKNE